ncbi:Carboxypeptidase regulatory-like domain-containing protein [Actinosynnema pretiosum]|nr:Carboxypeptidase regulatory-like domain-containing protein [Actinosynnema pretiosum]
MTGTAVGGDTSGSAIGVAPGATFMHGLIIPNGRGSCAQVVAGTQGAVAPIGVNGEQVGPPPDVVSMSLGGNGFLNEMIAPTRAIRAAGIVSVVAIGNNCGAAGTASPGNVHEAVAAGAADRANDVAPFSCGGLVRADQWSDPPADWPARWGKPDVSAPGVDVLSAVPGGGHDTLSGTSMATPHVAGTAALLRPASPDLPVDALFAGLADTSFWDDRNSPDRNSPDRPDPRFGHGRVNACEATARVVVRSGTTGTVTSGASGERVGGATVVVSPGDRAVTADANGVFGTRLEPGEYDLAVSAFGFEGAEVSGLVVEEDSFTAPPPARIAVAAGVGSTPKSYAQEYVDDVFAPVGVPATAYSHDQLALAARHPVVVLGRSSGGAGHDATRFQAVLDTTDASGSGVLFLDHPLGCPNGVSQLSRHTGQPEGTWSTAGWTDGEDLRYEVTAQHPVFGDRKVGDHVVLASAESSTPEWAAWFAGYAGGGRRIIGALGRNTGVVGGGVAVDQRAGNRHVLLSMQGAEPASRTADAREVFHDAVEWVSPEPPANAPHPTPRGLTASPGAVAVGDPVTVTARVKNVGGSAGACDAELEVRGRTFAVTRVDLAPGASTVVSWTVIPDTAGAHPISVGLLEASFLVR